MAFNNLYQANSLKTDDDEFSKEKILQGTYHALQEYKRYIEKSIELVQKTGAFSIPLESELNVFYLDLDHFSEQEKQFIIKAIFNNKNTKVFGKDNNTIKIASKNKASLKIEIKGNSDINAIYVASNQKANNNKQQIKLKIPLNIRHYTKTHNLSNNNANRVENELFEKEIKNVYSERPSSNYRDNRANQLSIKTRNAAEKYLIFYTNERVNKVFLKVNDYQLRKQKKAIEILMNKPYASHTALQKLFDLSWKSENYFDDSNTYFKEDIDWKILNQPDKYDGTGQQRDFVKKSLKTKNFALLEGPPGSGKTTAIIELIIQLIKQGKRVLLVSATHVAVDNVIHRVLTTFKKECEGLVVPLRIASDVGSIRQESVEPYLLETFVSKTKKDIKKNLKTNLKTKSRKTLYSSLNEDDNEFDDIILKSANLVGGTMIGILQHPVIKKGGIQEMFDVMIVDESSKVTFLDFLVPALYAKKWILVGDVNQLSPYTENDFINENIDIIVKDEKKKQKITSGFELNKKLLSNNKWDENDLKIIFSKNHDKIDFPNQEVFIVDERFKPSNENILKLNSVDVIICRPTDKTRKIISDYVFVKSLLFEGKIEHSAFKNKQNAFHENRAGNRKINIYKYEFKSDNKQQWKEMVGSRLAQMYQYRFEPELAKELKQEYDILVPKEIQPKLETIRRIALPSILELLQIGVGEKQRTTKSGKTYTVGKLIYEGFNQFPSIKEDKFQSLSYQHRMHDEIASLSRKHFYHNENLTTANTVNERRDVLAFYKPNEPKVIWVSNKDNTFRKQIGNIKAKNINPTEVNNIKSELENFIKKAKNHPKNNNDLYEIAILTFYREQEYQLKIMLQTLTNQNNKSKAFTVSNVKITLSTVDKFQGDEADMVLLSFTKFTRKAFYNSPNRLNVALTRARYKLVLYGNKNWLAKNAQLKALKVIAENSKNRLSH